MIRGVHRSLFITGSNPRSVLFGAYRYLEHLGVGWLWAGEEGELVPTGKDAVFQGVDIHEKASSVHRSVCIEGATSIEDVVSFVDWMAKKRMNGFLIQFVASLPFYQRYYEREYNPHIPDGVPLTEADAYRLDKKLIANIKKRGMMLHMLGHGCQCLALGHTAVDWKSFSGELPPEHVELLAEIEGKRGLFAPPWKPQGSLGLTELCWSNPKARRLVVDAVVEYAREHPEIDVMHYWLSDSFNNTCECDACRKAPISDWYLMCVNEVSARLRDRVRELVQQSLPEIDAKSIVLNATHTHNGPEAYTDPDLSRKLATYGLEVPEAWSAWGIDLGVMPAPEYREFAAQRIAEAVEQAWKGREPGASPTNV